MAEEKEQEEKPKSSNKSFMIIIVSVILVLLLVVGGLIFFLMSSGPEEESGNQQTSMQQNGKIPQNRPPGKRSNDFMNMGAIYPLDQFIVNLLSENGSRFLKAKIDLEESSEDLTPELDKKKALLRDIIIRTLSSKTFEEVSTAKGKDKLKDEIVGRINDVLSDGYIRNIFFTDFVVQ